MKKVRAKLTTIEKLDEMLLELQNDGNSISQVLPFGSSMDFSGKGEQYNGSLVCSVAIIYIGKDDV